MPSWHPGTWHPRSLASWHHPSLDNGVAQCAGVFIIIIIYIYIYARAIGVWEINHSDIHTHTLQTDMHTIFLLVSPRPPFSRVSITKVTNLIAPRLPAPHPPPILSTPRPITTDHPSPSRHARRVRPPSVLPQRFGIKEYSFMDPRPHGASCFDYRGRHEIHKEYVFKAFGLILRLPRLS